MALDYFAFGVCLCVVQIGTIFANLLTIIAFVKVRSLRTNASHLLIYALSLIDCFWGVYQFLYGLPFLLGLGSVLGEIGCMVTVPLDYVYYTGNLILVTISLDRVMLISLDYSKYVKLQSTSRIKWTICGCFLTCFVAALLELSFWNFAKRNNANAASIDFDETCLYPPHRMKWFGLYVSVCFFLLPLLLVCIFSVVFVNRLLVRIQKSRHIGNAASVGATSGSSSQNAESDSVDANESNVVRKRYIKPAVTLAALVSAMSLSLLPYCVYLLVVVVSESFSSDVTNIMWLVLQLNPFLDPFFYGATQKGIRNFYGGKIRGIFRWVNACRNPNQ